MAKAGNSPRLGPGDVVAERYRIDGVVGRGGFGAVYRATQTDTGRMVALKVLLKNFSSAKTDSKRFKREAALVQQLRHPKIVQLVDFGYTERQQPFIAFELLEGRSLSQVLKDEGPLPSWQAGTILHDMLEALSVAHRAGVIHRDIKPGNVFLVAGGSSAKVLDFGIAKAVGAEVPGATQLTDAGQMVGTPHYMAPEQVKGTELGPQGDVYAVGLVAAEMLSGERVVAGGALIDVYMAHIEDRPHVFPDVVRKSPLWPVIERATRKSPDQRHPSASEMLAEVAPIVINMSGEASMALTAARSRPSDLDSTVPIGAKKVSTVASAIADLSASTPRGGGTLLMEDASGQALSSSLARALAARDAGTNDPLDATMDMEDPKLLGALAPKPAEPLSSTHPMDPGSHRLAGGRQPLGAPAGAGAPGYGAQWADEGASGGYARSAERALSVSGDDASHSSIPPQPSYRGLPEMADEHTVDAPTHRKPEPEGSRRRWMVLAMLAVAAAAVGAAWVLTST